MSLTVLFVDDEPRILKALQRNLRSMSGQWDMTFVSDPEDALATMARASVDVIVSDMRMPRMDGGKLMGIVSRKYPGTYRIILSGDWEQDATQDDVRANAHQCLSKPCDKETLVRAIGQYDSPR